jgi:hypothetical protein
MLRNLYADNELNTQGRNVLEKLLVPQLVKKLPASHTGNPTKNPNQKHGKV